MRRFHRKRKHIQSGRPVDKQLGQRKHPQLIVILTVNKAAVAAYTHTPLEKTKYSNNIVVNVYQTL